MALPLLWQGVSDLWQAVPLQALFWSATANPSGGSVTPLSNSKSHCVSVPTAHRRPLCLSPPPDCCRDEVLTALLALGQGAFSSAISHASSRKGLIQGQGAGWPWEAYKGVFHFLSMLIFKQQLSAFWFQGLSRSGLGQLVYASPEGLNTTLPPV